MTPRPLRFTGLLTLALVFACDGGAEGKPASRGAASPKVAAAPAASAPTPTPAAVEPEAEPTPTEVKAEPTPTPTEVEVEPTPTPTEVKAEPTPVPTDDEEEPTIDDEEPTPAAGPAATATGAELTTPIALGPDAELLRLVLAHDVVDRQPVDPSTTFPAGQRVNLFVEARNEGEEAQSVRVTWENVATGRRSPPTNVAIGVRKLHRTRAFRTMRKPGSYRAIVLGEGDVELAVLPFTVE